MMNHHLSGNNINASCSPAESLHHHAVLLTRPLPQYDHGFPCFCLLLREQLPWLWCCEVFISCFWTIALTRTCWVQWRVHCCRLVVAEGGEDVTIKVSDEGGGIPRSGLARIWTYLYSTARSRVVVEELQVRYCDTSLLGTLFKLPHRRLECCFAHLLESSPLHRHC